MYYLSITNLRYLNNAIQYFKFVNSTRKYYFYFSKIVITDILDNNN